MPQELRVRVREEVERTKSRSGWPVGRTLCALGVSRTSYYRWLRREVGGGRADGVLQPFETLAEEKEAVVDYALRHAALRHREMAWRMVDEDVAYLSPSTVYRILRERDLVSPWRRRSKRRRGEDEKAKRPDERWATDLLHLKVEGRECYLVCFLDEYSRYVVYHELLTRMDGATVSLAAQAALETLSGEGDSLVASPEIRSDNGSGYVSSEFRGVLREHKLSHHRIKPHCPEENGLMERTYRTFREALEGEDLGNWFQARDTVARIIRWYNEERLHSALGYLRPLDYYRGDPKRLEAARRAKLVAARHRRREANLGVRQLTLPLSVGVC